MKKIMLVLLFMLVALPVFGADSMEVKNLISGSYTLAAGESIAYSVSKGSEGFFSIQPVFTGAGTLNIDYQTSNSNSHYNATNTVNIVTGAVTEKMYWYPASGVNNFSYYQKIIITAVTDTVVLTGLYRCKQ